MKISIENNIRHYDNMAYKSRLSANEKETPAAKKNCDEVIIGSGPSQVEDKKIAAELARNVMHDVRQAAPADKLESLKQQIKQGLYQVDTERIVSAMLLEKGHTEDE